MYYQKIIFETLFAIYFKKTIFLFLIVKYVFNFFLTKGYWKKKDGSRRVLKCPKEHFEKDI